MSFHKFLTFLTILNNPELFHKHLRTVVSEEQDLMLESLFAMVQVFYYKKERQINKVQIK